MIENAQKGMKKEVFKMSMIRLMSHNQWACNKNMPAWEEQGLDCSAEVREKGFARVFGEILPDIIGLQEMTDVMTDYMIRYSMDVGLHYALLWGNYTPIAYRPDKLDLVDTAFRVYPEEIPGYEGSFNNSRSKSYSIGVFRIKENGNFLIFATTHLWYMDEPDLAGSDQARAYQIGMLIDHIDVLQKKYDCPAIIVGDFNADYHSLALQKAFSCGFLHTHDIAVEYKDETNGYHGCGVSGYDPYVPAPFECGIDHILVRNAPVGAIRRFDRYYPEYYMPLSDHFPVFVDIEL